MAEAPGEQYGQEFPTLRYVLYNDGDGTNPAVVLHDHGDTKLNLFVLAETGSFEEGVPHREPEDYGDEGGGRTWRYPR